MYKARVEIPCRNNRCDGMWRLAERTKLGLPLEEPVYVCERKDCYYYHNPVPVRNTTGNHITEDYRQLGSYGKKPGKEL